MLGDHFGEIVCKNLYLWYTKGLKALIYRKGRMRSTSQLRSRRSPQLHHSHCYFWQRHLPNWQPKIPRIRRTRIYYPSRQAYLLSGRSWRPLELLLGSIYWWFGSILSGRFGIWPESSNFLCRASGGNHYDLGKELPLGSNLDLFRTYAFFFIVWIFSTAAAVKRANLHNQPSV